MQHNHVDVEDERVCRSQIENAQKKCAGPGLVTLKSRGTSWLRILLRWAHLLHRSTSETGGSVLKYDFEYILLHYAIGFYMSLTFVFGLTGKLHPAKKNCQLLSMKFGWTAELVKKLAKYIATQMHPTLFLGNNVDRLVFSQDTEFTKNRAYRAAAISFFLHPGLPLK